MLANAYSEIHRVFEQVKTATIRGGVKWAKTDDDQTFMLSGKSGSFEIGNEEDEEDPQYTEYVFRITNDAGDIVQVYRARNNRELSDEFEDLFEMARQSALDVPGLIEALRLELGLPDIDEPGSSGPPPYNPGEEPF